MAVEYVETKAHRRGRSRRRVRAQELSLLRRMDWILFGAVAALVAYGLTVVNGITQHDIEDNPRYFLIRQAIFAGVGVLGLLVALILDPSVYQRFWRAIYVVTVAVIALVFVAAPVVRGSRRWLDIGFFKFQPSEFGKLLIVLALAGFLADRGKRMAEAPSTLATIGLAALPTALVFLQPDFGTALVYGAGLAAVLLVGGTRWISLAAVGAATLLAAIAVLWLLPAAGVQILKPYQQERITGFTNPDADPSGATYNVTQSVTAVGAGRFDGRGVAGATQTSLGFNPEHATDFAFASLSEQRGFVGASILLCLYLLVVWRGLRIITVARDAFSAIVAGGITFALLFQIGVNVGMTMGIAPITGIPLPFVSVGGSSMIANLTAMGVLLSIHVRGTPYRNKR
jgi:rod shape determining protein RodA